MHATIDFETVSFAGYAFDFKAGKLRSLPGFDSTKRSLQAVGTRVYVEHWSFRPLMLAYDMGRGIEQWLYGDTSYDTLFRLFAHVRRNGIVEAHNVEFERTVWNHYCVPVLKWPRLHIQQLRCSAAKSRAWGYPGKLEAVAAVLKTPTQKDKDGERLMKMFSIPRNPTKARPTWIIEPADEPLEYERYKAYNRTDVSAEIEVSQRVPELTPTMQEEWFLDAEINDRGVQVDTKGIHDCIAIVEQAYAKYGDEHRQLTGGIESNELQQVKTWLEAQGVFLPDMQAATIEATVERLDDQLKEGDPADAPLGDALRVLQIRQLIGSASVKKLYALDAQTARDGRVYGMYQFHSTHHGRTGGYGPQPSNLYKGEWHEPAEIDAALNVLAVRNLAVVELAYPKLGPLDVVNNVLRSLFIAAPDHVFMSSDYNAIEAVCLAVLAGEQWVIDVFNSHGMIYEATIVEMTGIPFADFVKHRTDTGGIATYADDGSLMHVRGGKHHPLRQKGKLADLSGGYASWINGWKKFGADKYYADDNAIKQAILRYRDVKPMTVEFWGGQTRDKFRPSERQEYYGLEGAAIQAVLNPGTAYRYRLIGFQMAGDCLYMQLPSGRLISYHAPRLTPATREYASSWELALSYEGWNSDPKRGPPAWMRMDLYGGVLTQNACGGTARDIMMHGMLNVTRAGYSIVLHTYDEVVTEVRADDASKTVAGLEAELNDLPTWAKGWPIFARGGWKGPRYGKWD